MSYYDYKDLRKSAIENPTFENLEALASWLDAYDSKSWNGEKYDIDEGLCLVPVYKETAPDEFEIVEYKIERW